MEITFDPAKRDETLIGRKLDFADAKAVFEGPTLTVEDDRKDYGESRFISYGMLDGRMVAMVWTPRGATRRLISMRHCHEDEASRIRHRLR